MMKIAVFLAVVAVATAAPGAIFTAGVLPASTGPLTYAAPAVVAAPAYTVAHATPVVHAAAPVVHAAGPAIVAAPVAYAAGVKVTHTVQPVEQHGYQISY